MIDTSLQVSSLTKEPITIITPDNFNKSEVFSPSPGIVFINGIVLARDQEEFLREFSGGLSATQLLIEFEERQHDSYQITLHPRFGREEIVRSILNELNITFEDIFCERPFNGGRATSLRIKSQLDHVTVEKIWKAFERSNVNMRAAEIGGLDYNGNPMDSDGRLHDSSDNDSLASNILFCRGPRLLETFTAMAGKSVQDEVGHPVLVQGIQPEGHVQREHGVVVIENGNRTLHEMLTVFPELTIKAAVIINTKTLGNEAIEAAITVLDLNRKREISEKIIQHALRQGLLLEVRVDVAPLAAFNLEMSPVQLSDIIKDLNQIDYNAERYHSAPGPDSLL